MATSTETAPKYRKTKTGEWVVYAPAADLGEGVAIDVRKASGEWKVEHIERVGRSFTVDGVAMAYGYIARTKRQPYADSPVSRGSGYADDSCAECQERRGTTWATDSSGIAGKVCGRCARSASYELSFA